MKDNKILKVTVYKRTVRITDLVSGSSTSMDTTTARELAQEILDCADKADAKATK